jgi:hypothetical protein
MADYTITISNNLYAFGPDKLTPSLWGTFQWGGYWAYEAIDLICEVEKAISNAITPSEAALTFEVEKSLSEAITPSETFGLEASFERTIENTLTPSFETSDETLTNGTWNYVFIKPSANAEDRNLATFTTQANASTTWLSSTATSTSWS